MKIQQQYNMKFSPMTHELKEESISLNLNNYL